MGLLAVLTIFTGISFLIYGLSCLLSAHMKTEFIRFGLPGWRRTTGYLQIIGGIGLLLGLLNPVLAGISAAGLALLMLLGFGVRLYIRDGLLPSSPAFVFMLLNTFLALGHFKILFQ